MRKDFAIAAGIFAIALLVLGIVSYQPTGASPPNAIPTSIPDTGGAVSNALDRGSGGVIHGGIAIQGSENEQQLIIVANSTQTAATPVFDVQAQEGSSVFGVLAGGAGGAAGGVRINAPTAQATAVPGLVIDNYSSGANSLSLRSGGSDVSIFPKAGGLTLSTGNLNMTSGNLAMSSGLQVMTVPTAQGTATPGFTINNSSKAMSFEVRNAATTPVAWISKTGTGNFAGALTVVSGGLTVTAGGLTVTAGGATITAGNLTVTAGNEIITAGNLTLTAGKIINTIPVAIAVTQGSIITPTGSINQLSAAGSVSTASIAAGVSGQLLILLGPDSNTVTISDTGTLKLTGDLALSANDTLSLVSDGTNWNEVSFSNN